MILIAIATYKRIKKLKRLLESLEKQTYRNFKVVVVCDNNDLETAEYIENLNTTFDIAYVVQPEHKFVIGAWNRVIKEYFNLKVYPNNFNYFLGLCDDVELKENALEVAYNANKEHFKDTDGVVGFNQICPGHPEYTFKWYGQTLMGREFIERYACVDYKICCPFYSHFHQDFEMWKYASSLNKFIECKEAVLYHYHPSFIKEQVDETHNIIRVGYDSPIKKDNLMFAERQKRGLIWGESFDSIEDYDNRKRTS